MPEIKKGILKIAGYAVDEGEWSSRVNVWGNEAILRSRASLPVSLNQIVNVTYEQGGNVYTLIQNGLVNKIEVREEGFEKYYEYTVWGREWVGKYRITSETGTIEAATVKLQKYCQILGLTPIFYNMSGVTIAPNAIATEYIADIIDNIRTSAYTYSADTPYPVTINYYFKIDGSPVFFVGTIGSLTLNTPLTYREKTEDLSNVYNQIKVWSNYHPVKDTFDLFTDTVQGSYKYYKSKIWPSESDWTDWISLSADSTNKVSGNISLKTGPIPAVHFPIVGAGNMEAFVRIPTNAGSLVASSLTGFFVVIGSSLNPKSSGISSLDLKGKIFLGPDPMEGAGDNVKYFATEFSFYATTVLTWHTISLSSAAFITKNKIKDEERSSITLDYVHFQIKNDKVFKASLENIPEFTFWFDKGYLTETAGTVVVDSDSQAQYGIRELAPEEIGFEPKTGKRYAEMIAKGKSLLRPKPERFYSRVEIPATISPPILGYYYTFIYGSTVATGLLTELRLEVREDTAPKWVLTLSSSPDYPARTKLYKKLEKLESAVRFLLNAPGYEVTPVEGRIIPYLLASEITTNSGFIAASYVQNFQAEQVPYIGSIGTIGNIGSLNVDYIGYIGSIGNIGYANFQNIGNIDQISSIGNVSYANITNIGRIEKIDTITQANFDYIGNIGSIGYIGSIDRMSVGRIDRIDRIDNINYANIVQADITNLGAIQNLQCSYLNVTNMATLISASITNAYVTNISHISTLSADNLFVSNIGSIGSAYITNANIVNISSLDSASIGTAYISVIQGVDNLTATNIDAGIITAVKLTAIDNVRATDLFCYYASIDHIQTVSYIYAGSLNVATISNVKSLVADNVTINTVERVGKIVALTTQIQIGEGAQNVFIPVPSTVYNIYGMPGATIKFDIGTVDTFLVGTISADSISFRIGTVDTFYIGSASASVMKFNIGTVDNITVNFTATGGSLSFRAGSIGNITIGSIDTVEKITVTDVGTINNLEVVKVGHIATFRLDAGTISSVFISAGTIESCTISAGSIGTAVISSGTLDYANIRTEDVGTINVITGNLWYLNVSVSGTLTYATIRTSAIQTMYVSSGSISSLTVTSGKIDNLSVTASTINKLEITTPLIGRGVIRADNLIFLPVNWYPNSDFEFIDDAGNVVDWTGITRVSPGYGNVGYAGVVPANSYAWANVTLDVLTGEVLRFRGYTKSGGGHGFALKLLDANYNPISTTPILLGAVADWYYRSIQVPITVAGVVHAVPGLYAGPQPATFDQISLSKDVGSINIGDGQITTPKLAASIVTSDKIAAGAITAEKIAAGQITTEHIRFTLLTSDPTYEPGKMWYRSDLDELRFSSGDSPDKVMQIPKIPVGAPIRSLIWHRSSWHQDCEAYAAASIDFYSSGVDIWTDVNVGTYGQLYKYIPAVLATWNKRRILSVLLTFSSVAYTRVRIYSGYYWEVSGSPSFGVYFDNNSSSTTATLYGTSWSGSARTSVVLGTVSEGGTYLITMEFIPGEFIKFYINGQYAGIIITNLPSGSTNAHELFIAEVFNYYPARKRLRIYQVACCQDL